MKEYEIWSEGYAATGERGTAHYYGKAMGETFEEACKNFRYPEDIWAPSFTPGPNLGRKIVVQKGETLKLDEGGHYPYPSIWACRLFDNEADARKSFG